MFLFCLKYQTHIFSCRMQIKAEIFGFKLIYSKKTVYEWYVPTLICYQLQNVGNVSQNYVTIIKFIIRHFNRVAASFKVVVNLERIISYINCVSMFNVCMFYLLKCYKYIRLYFLFIVCLLYLYFIKPLDQILFYSFYQLVIREYFWNIWVLFSHKQVRNAFVPENAMSKFYNTHSCRFYDYFLFYVQAVNRLFSTCYFRI